MITKRIDMRGAGVVFQVISDGKVVWQDEMPFTGTMADRDAGPRMRTFIAEMERQAKALGAFEALGGVVPQ